MTGLPPAAMSAERRRLPDTRPSVTHTFVIRGQQDHRCYLTVGLYDDGTPGEVFLRIGKAGSTLNGLLDTIGILISYGLQYSVPLGDLCRKLKNMTFEPDGETSNEEIPQCASIVDYLFRWLEQRFGPFEEHAPSSVPTGEGS